jgi:O-antigen/teichoic acid export membrane protein
VSLQLGSENLAGYHSRMLFTQSAVSLALRISGMVCQMASFLLLIRAVTIEQVGVYATLSAIWLLARFLGPLGYDQTVMRFVPEMVAAGRLESAYGLERFAVTRVASVTLLVITVMWLAGVVLGAGINVPLTSGDLVIACGTVPAYVMLGLMGGVLRSRREVAWAQAPETMILNGLILLGILGIWGTKQSSFTLLLIVSAAAAWISAGVAFMRWLGRYKTRHTAISVGERRAFTEASIRVFVSLAITAFANRLPVPMTALLIGSQAAASMEAAFRVSLIPTLATWAVSVVFTPTLASALADDRSTEVQRMLGVGAWLSFIPAAVFLVVLILSGRWLLPFMFGNSYSDCYLLAVVVTIASVINAATSTTSAIFLVTGHERILAVYSSLALVTLLCFGSAAALAFGAVGIAVSFLIGGVLRDIGLCLRLRPALHLDSGVLSFSGLVEVGRLLKGGRGYY